MQCGRQSGGEAPELGRLAVVNELHCKRDRSVTQNGQSSVIYVIGADGDIITRGSLPPSSTQHWRIRLKAKVVAAVESGMITREEACAKYRMSAEEYFEWRRRVEQSGLAVWETRYAKPQGPNKSL